MFAYTKIMQGIQAVSAAVTDAYFNLVTLLLPGNGTNGAQNNTFLDSSSNNFTITRNGNTTQGTFSPFSQTGWSNYFDGTNDFLTTPSNTAFDFGTGDFTVEFWAYVQNSGSAALVGTRTGDTSTDIRWGIFVDSTGSMLLQIYNTSNALIGTITFQTSFPKNSFVHCAAVRSGTSFRLYQNGVQSTSSITSSAAVANSSTVVRVGDFDTSSLADLDGYISNLRITKGGALYTSGFTPSTTPLTTTVSAGTVSLLTCQSNRFIDNSSNAFAITVNGTPSVQAFSPFAPTAAYSASTNGGSGYFDGAGDYLTAGTTSNFNFLHNSSALFTIEGWVYASSFASSVELFGTNSGTSNEVGTVFSINSSSQLRLLIGRGVSASPVIDATSTGTVSLNQWVHVAVTYDQSLASSNCIFYINGVSSGTVNKTANAPSSSSSAYPGTINAFGTSSGGACYLSGIRVNNSIVYTSAFTPPTAPPTAITNTQLLLNFTNAGITDATAKNDLETVGNAQISTTQSKFGGSSMYFDGTGDYLRPNSGNIFNFGTGDFTVEFWLYLNSTAAQTFIDCRPGSAGDYILFDYDPTSKLRLYVGSTTVLSGSTLATGQWYHIALARSGSTVKYFIDGTQGASATMTTNLLSSANPYIGCNYVPDAYVNGYIDDLRVTKGYARYTASFTAPTAAFALQ